MRLNMIINSLLFVLVLLVLLLVSLSVLLLVSLSVLLLVVVLVVLLVVVVVVTIDLTFYNNECHLTVHVSFNLTACLLLTGPSFLSLLSLTILLLSIPLPSPPRSSQMSLAESSQAIPAELDVSLSAHTEILQTLPHDDMGILNISNFSSYKIIGMNR